MKAVSIRGWGVPSLNPTRWCHLRKRPARTQHRHGGWHVLRAGHHDHRQPVVVTHHGQVACRRFTSGRHATSGSGRVAEESLRRCGHENSWYRNRCGSSAGVGSLVAGPPPWKRDDPTVRRWDIRPRLIMRMRLPLCTGPPRSASERLRTSDRWMIHVKPSTCRVLGDALGAVPASRSRYSGSTSERVGADRLRGTSTCLAASSTESTRTSLAVLSIGWRSMGSSERMTEVPISLVHRIVAAHVDED